MLNKNVYEIGFLINPDLSQQEATDAVDNIKDIIAKSSASVISEGEVVDIDLAYQIITKINSLNERFDKAYFSWVKFEGNTETISVIKKEIDKNKKQVFRYLITKTVADDEATNKYEQLLDSDEEDGENKSEKEVKSDIIDTTSKEDDIKNDDFTKVEGIGPKIAETLIENGIKSFSELSQKTSNEISEIISDVRGSHETDTWPKQAKMASEGEWEQLKKWQDEMDGGKE